MTKNIITQNRLKELLSYDLDTGLFTWRISKLKVKKGVIAGTNFSGYTRIKVDRKSYLAHRLAWLYVHGYFPEFIDHINHERNDNRLINLREATRTDNARNVSKHKTNTSGVMGVSWRKDISKWAAFIRIDNKIKHLGCFINIDDAVSARQDAEYRLGYHVNHGH